MIEDRKIISLTSRQPVVILSREDEEAAEVLAIDEETQLDIDADLRAIDEFRMAVANGSICGVILIARHLETGLFFTDIAPNFRRQPEKHECLSAMLYGAHLDELKSEMMDLASVRPQLITSPEGEIEVVGDMPYYGEDDEDPENTWPDGEAS